MKALSEMIAYVRRKLRDASENAPVWENADILDELESAWFQVRAALAEHPAGQKTVAVWSDPASLVADQEEYALPADILMVVGVQWRQNSDAGWCAVPYKAPVSTGGVSSGTSSLLGLVQPANMVSGMAWYDDADPGYIRFWPAKTVVDSEQYRLQVVPEIPFPSADSATLRDPLATGADVYRLPDRLDTATCFLACSLLALEELENGKPIGAFGTMYASTMRDITSSARILRPHTRYVGGPR